MIDPFVLQNILLRNQGQVITPELVLGIMQGSSFAPDYYIDLSIFEPEKCGSYTFQAERVKDIVGELHPLHEAHWLETEKHRHGLELAYDYAAIAEQDKQGRFIQFTIRKNGELVGYSGMAIHRSTHTQTLVANEDSLFLRSDCRGGRTIFRFVEYLDKSLTKLGVKEVRLSSKIINSADKLMMKCGFTPFATQLVKFLGVENEAQTTL